MHVRINDIVEVMSGDDAGKTGKILKVIPKKQKAVVEGINYILKHVKPSQKNPQGGRVQKEAPMVVSNVLVVCPNKSCTKYNRGVRTRMKLLDNGNRVRACVKCGHEIIVTV
ncbi:MAG TPA: 50S ribosomal protein L24 [Candidatus Brocadiia bacterium]|nr:50S ribosomal protein L24 [Candidatus Brocadiales bacterium]